MDLILTRKSFTEKGIFGELTGYGFHCFTLEHSYNMQAKLSTGKYYCVRHAPKHIPYETFMVIGVPDFNGVPVSGILIHKGNFDKDSEGCILVGKGLDRGHMILDSKDAFEELMGIQKDIDSFKLEVINP